MRYGGGGDVARLLTSQRSTSRTGTVIWPVTLRRDRASSPSGTAAECQCRAHTGSSQRLRVVVNLLAIFFDGPFPAINRRIVLEHAGEFSPGIRLRTKLKPHDLRPILEPGVDFRAQFGQRFLA